MPKKPIKRKRGRPFAEIDPTKLCELASHGNTQADIALHFRVSRQTIENRLRGDPALREAYERGLALCRISIRAALFKQMDEKPVAAIFLAKSMLGLRDDYRDFDRPPDDNVKEIRFRWAEPETPSSEKSSTPADQTERAAAPTPVKSDFMH